MDYLVLTRFEATFWAPTYQVNVVKVAVPRALTRRKSLAESFQSKPFSVPRTQARRLLFSRQQTR
jgi:hypothetical protein